MPMPKVPFFLSDFFNNRSTVVGFKSTFAATACSFSSWLEKLQPSLMKIIMIKDIVHHIAILRWRINREGSELTSKELMHPQIQTYHPPTLYEESML